MTETQTVLPPNYTIYIKNLNDKTKIDRMKESLYSSFTPFGKILEISMHKARRLRGQAWITFDSVAEASNALRTMQGTQIFDKPMEIQFGKDTADIIARREGTFIPREKRKRPVVEIPINMEEDSENEMENPTKAMKKTNIPPPPIQNTISAPNKILFLQNLPASCTDEMLSVLFEQYHGFKEVRMVPGNKGLAFVEFTDEPTASIALQGLKGFKLTATETLHIMYAKK